MQQEGGAQGVDGADMLTLESRRPRFESRTKLKALKNAEKRVLIRVAPDKVVSWNHAKLAGVY